MIGTRRLKNVVILNESNCKSNKLWVNQVG